MTSDIPQFRFDMARTGFRKTTRYLIATAIGSIAVAGSLALAGTPDGVWLKSGNAAERAALDRDLARNGQPLRYTQVGAKDGMTPISAEVRGVPRPEQNTPMRGAGSIRADITRYNEERGMPRPPGRPGDDPRSAANSNYRN
ncbi:peptide-binding protein [Caballeronia arationis]|jgi:hypothetical protein|uniref:Peptide-binding protein n=1 Tax=Caballeronia arationis TaxID=1777142 RepID=A0A7Z7ICL3_9BURK|nr:hypothetical protein [Caballeronia arationis]SAK88551.1 peptide-binding protein [Caballeronia arationis]SOE82942.1 hypothetical protein SAMN05446927_6290 [Caballeronia arationis]